MLLYGTWVWLFGEIIFYDWIGYPLRKYFVQNITMLIADIMLFVPGFSMITMPLLGYFAIWDFLDYPDWAGIEYTLYEAFYAEDATNPV